MNNDYLFIEELHVSARVGHTLKERAFPQTLKITIHLQLPLLKAGKKDNLLYTADYAKVYSKIKSHVATKKFILIETLAEDIASLALQDKKIISVTVWVRKAVFHDTKSVGACIQRSQILKKTS